MALAAGACDPAAIRADGYERHRPEETLLYRVVHEHWPTFRELAEERGGLPSFVTRELDEYLRCGILEHGLVHLCCERCGHPMVVAFSCKRRGFCPSCTARRMSDVAAHLVDEVLPEVPIRDVARRTHAALITLLARHGRSFDGTDEDIFATEEPVLASCAGASAADLVLLGERAGQRTTKLGRTLRLVSSDSNGSYAEFDGVNIHAGAAIDGRDRKRLERVCRYVARPPLALERLEEHGDGRLRYRFKKPWKDGTEAVLLEPMDLIARLAALVPPPRFHMLS